MKRKIIVSLFIFLLLFSSAWFLQHQQQNHRTVDKIESSINNLNVVPINYENTPFNSSLNTEEINVQWNLSEPFRPREYVRFKEY
ncbi:hypothetical protein [Bacillus benzoevorans]|uniref:Uncharacterized protein n=1 Tax=Bacillus benzoevorans TaxID=1456 RepID=A0A7X0HSX2_9BACI|nr:hypothetical protein [Bacillus benzoevorans]MBB6446258.1 hypothetical protein [Bacillus benzoevorans]